MLLSITRADASEFSVKHISMNIYNLLWHIITHLLLWNIKRRIMFTIYRRREEFRVDKILYVPVAFFDSIFFGRPRGLRIKVIHY